MAQLVERLIRNQQIVSSNLTGGSIRYKGLRRRYLRKPFFFFFFYYYFSPFPPSPGPLLWLCRLS